MLLNSCQIYVDKRVKYPYNKSYEEDSLGAPVWEQKRKMKSMQLVEQHCIDRRDPRYAVIDEAAFKSKNLYNAANYEYRQTFIHEGRYPNYHEVQKRMQSHEAYKALPAKVSQQVLKQLHEAWISFFEARDAYEADPSKFKGRSKLPKGRK